MKNLFILLIVMLILIVIGLSGCLEDSSKDNALSGLDYSNSEYDFGLNPPEGWITDEDDQVEAVRFYGPTVDEFTMNIGISKPSITAPGTVESLSSVVITLVEYYSSYFTNFSEISNSSRTVNGMNAHDLVYTFTQGVHELKQMQVLIEKNKTTFGITFTASEDSFDDYISVVEESIETFTIA